MFLPHLPVPPFSKMTGNKDVSAAHEAAVKLSYFRAIKSTRIKEGGEKNQVQLFFLVDKCLYSCK